MVKKRNGILVFVVICVVSIVIALLIEFFVGPKTETTDTTTLAATSETTTQVRRVTSVYSPVFGAVNEATFEMVEELFAVSEGTQGTTKEAKLLMEMIHNRGSELFRELPVVIFEISDHYDYNTDNAYSYYDEVKNFLTTFTENDFQLNGEENYRISSDGITFKK